MPDGRTLATVVTEVQARDTRRPGSAASRFDNSMSLPDPVGAR